VIVALSLVTASAWATSSATTGRLSLEATTSKTLSVPTTLHAQLQPQFCSWVVAALDDEASAFTDQIDYLDGFIQTLLGVFGLVMLALVGIKVVTDQMDNAIEQVLVDFETTMQKSYPQRWQNDFRPVLESLDGTEREQKLLKLMEELQSKDPEFMNRVQQKMKIKSQ
jgi:hypothetical protein